MPVISKYVLIDMYENNKYTFKLNLLRLVCPEWDSTLGLQQPLYLNLNDDLNYSATTAGWLGLVCCSNGSPIQISGIQIPTKNHCSNKNVFV